MTDTAADRVPGSATMTGMTGAAPAAQHPGAGQFVYADSDADSEQPAANGNGRAENGVRPATGPGPQSPPGQQPGAARPPAAQQAPHAAAASTATAQPASQSAAHTASQPAAQPAGQPAAPPAARQAGQQAGQASPQPSAQQPRQQAGQPSAQQAGQQAGQGTAGPGQVAAGTFAAAAQQPGRGPARADGGAERGRTKIAEEVVEKIAGLAARQVQGVHSLGGDVARALGSIRERIGLGESSKAQGVSVEMAERRVIVDLVIVVAYGYVIMEVATAVRVNVITAVERMLGLQVVEVNIAVDDVHMPDDEDERAHR